jgi:NitT/TauT family transport system substrate-binding protein
MTRRGPFLPALVCVLVALTLAACNPRSEGSGRGAGEPVKSVRIGYFANLAHAQAVLGVSSGELAEAVAPARLESKVFNAGPSVVEALFAGEIDVAYLGPGPAMRAHVRSGGQGIRVIAGAAANGVTIVARKGSGIHALADLRGRRIATPQLGNTQDLSARHYVVHELGQPDADNVLAVPNAEQSTMMARGWIDAAWAPEPWGERLVRETGAAIIAEEKDLWSAQRFILALVVTTPDFLAAHPEVLEKMLNVHRAWTNRLAGDVDRFSPVLGDALFGLTGKRLGEGVLRSAIRRVTFTDEPLEDSIEVFASWADEVMSAPRPSDVSGLVDTTILRRLQRVDEAKQGGR